MTQSVAAVETDTVVLAVDPHKGSWTAVAVDRTLQPQGTIRVDVDDVGYRQLQRFAKRWPRVEWAIEGAAGLGAPLSRRLHADGVDPLDVPVKLASRIRTLSTGHGRKSDPDDALSVGIAAWHAPTLRRVRIDEDVAALRLLVEHREDLVTQRTQTVNRLMRCCRN